MYIKKYKTKSLLNVKEYKKQYYINNIDVYNQRNRQASENRTLERIEKLSSDEIIYKLKVILEFG